MLKGFPPLRDSAILLVSNKERLSRASYLRLKPWLSKKQRRGSIEPESIFHSPVARQLRCEAKRCGGSLRVALLLRVAGVPRCRLQSSARWNVPTFLPLGEALQSLSLDATWAVPRPAKLLNHAQGGTPVARKDASSASDTKSDYQSKYKMVIPYGKQNYQCKECQRQFIEEYTKIGYPLSVKESYPTTLKMYVNGLGFRAIERVSRVNHNTIIRWVKAAANKLPNAPSVEEMPEITEIDELQTFVGKKAVRPPRMVQHPLAFPCASRILRLDVASCSISSTGRRPATLFRASQRRRTPRRLLGRKLPTQNAPTVRARGVLTQFARPRQPRGTPRNGFARQPCRNGGF